MWTGVRWSMVPFVVGTSVTWLCAAQGETAVGVRPTPTASFERVPVPVVRMAQIRTLADWAWDADVSPDESKMTFVQLGGVPPKRGGVPRDERTDLQICTAHIDGSNRRVLVSGPGIRSNPVFSPSGDRIAFVQAPGQLRLVGADGAGRTRARTNATCSGRPAWSPDGKTVAFHAVDRGIGLYDVGRESLRVIPLPRSAGTSQPVDLNWTPDSRRLYFRSGTSVWRLDVTTGPVHRVCDGVAYSLSPDGRVVARFRREPQRCFLDFVDARSLESTTICSDRRLSWGGRLTWSREGGRLVFGRFLVDTGRALTSGGGACAFVPRYTSGFPSCEGSQALLRDGRLISECSNAIVSIPRPNTFYRRQIRESRFVWNSAFASKKQVEIRIPAAINRIVRAVRPAHAPLLGRPIKSAAAPTRIVCTEVVNRLCRQMLRLASTKHPEDLRYAASHAFASHSGDPLVDGSNHGFRRYLRQSDPLSGGFAERGGSGMALYADKVRYIRGYPIVMRKGLLRYDSLAQAVKVDFTVEGSGEVHRDLLQLVFEELEPFFALEFLHDADRIYGIPLEETLQQVAKGLGRRDRNRQDSLRAGVARFRLPDEGWPAHRRDLNQSGSSGGDLSLPLEQKWLRKLGGRPRRASPLVDDKYVYVARTRRARPRSEDYRATLHVLDRVTGHDAATIEVDGAIPGTPVISAGRVFHAVTPTQVRALEKETWKTLWTQYLPGGVTETPLTLAKGRLLVLAGSAIYALDPMDGHVLWSHPVRDDSGAGFIVAEDTLVHPDRERGWWALVARRVIDGQELWRRELPRRAFLTWHDALSGDGHRAFVGTHEAREGTLRTFDIASGKMVWQRNTGPAYRLWPTRFGGTVVVQNHDGRLVALTPDTGKDLWTGSFPEGIAACPPIVVGRHVLGVTRQDLHVLDLNTRRTLQSLRLPVRTDGAPSLAFYDGTVYVSGGGGSLLALAGAPR